jgi:hypothetical protein
MLKNTGLEFWQLSSAVNKPSDIFQRAERTGPGGREERNFLPMLKEGLAAFNVKEPKAAAGSGMREILENMEKDCDIGKGKNAERKQEMNGGTQVPEEKTDEWQVGMAGIPAGVQGANISKTDDHAVQDGSADVAQEEGGENDAVGIERLAKGIGNRGGGVTSFKIEAENGVPFSPDPEQLTDVDHAAGNALREKGIDGKDIGKMLAAIKEGELKSVPLERQAGGATVEKDIGKMLAAIKEGELKSVPLERQAGEATVERGSGAGMFKGMPFDSDAEKGDGRGDSPSFSGKDKVTAAESFTLAGQTDVTSYGGESKVIKSGDAKPIEGRLLVDQIAGQLPSEADKGFSRVRIALFPEKLGGLDMDIMIRENKIHVILTADRPDVRQALQNHSDQLRNALQNQGLQVDGIDFLQRDSPRGMDGGSGGGHLSWREDNGGAKGGEREQDVPASSAMPLLPAGKTSGTAEGGISLFV